MKCAICNEGNALEASRQVTRQFRGEDYVINESFYNCDSCKAEYSSTEQDQLAVTQVYNLYREKYRILFPDQIKAIRERYQLSASKMSEVLGFGINTYRNYENGEIPNQPHSELIMLISDPIIFKRTFERKRDTLKSNEYSRLSNLVDELRQHSESPTLRINTHCIPNEYTGFKKPNIKKITNVLLYFLHHIADDTDKVKLNKLFFYSDFYHYKKTGYSITGITYRANLYGPSPTNHDVIYPYLENIGVIEASYDTAYREFFNPVKTMEEECFNESEHITLKHIHGKLGALTTGEIKDVSHKETAWTELNSEKKEINYQKYAFALKGV